MTPDQLDAKIGEWGKLRDHPNRGVQFGQILDALEAERDRADEAEYERDIWSGMAMATAKARDRLFGVLWASRRQWQNMYGSTAEQRTLIADTYETAEAKLTAVRNLHATVDARWSSEGPDVKRCRHCGQLSPCDTALVVGE